MSHKSWVQKSRSHAATQCLEPSMKTLSSTRRAPMMCKRRGSEMFSILRTELTLHLVV